MTRRFDRNVVIALALITILYLVLFGYFIGATALRVPVVDEIYWVTPLHRPLADRRLLGLYLDRSQCAPLSGAVC